MHKFVFMHVTVRIGSFVFFNNKYYIYLENTMEIMYNNMEEVVKSRI